MPTRCHAARCRAGGPVAPDVVSYNAIIGACARAGQVAEGASTLDAMALAGVRANRDTFAALVAPVAAAMPGAAAAAQRLALRGVLCGGDRLACAEASDLALSVLLDHVRCQPVRSVLWRCRTAQSDISPEAQPY